tara:strand:+ start:355 stop:663 length:309 start_codon:yes stop_codon:yes gene_type:complete
MLKWVRSPSQNEVLKMDNIVNNRFILKSGSYIIDLISVDFLTWKKTTSEVNTYWLKMHIGTKEARHICDKFELKQIVEAWTRVHGDEIEIDINLIGDENEFN